MRARLHSAASTSHRQHVAALLAVLTRMVAVGEALRHSVVNVVAVAVPLRVIREVGVVAQGMVPVACECTR